MVPILEKEDLKHAILKRLVYSVGKDWEHATSRDWCVAVILVVRDRLMDRWLTTTRQTYDSDSKRVYYLSILAKEFSSVALFMTTWISYRGWANAKIKLKCLGKICAGRKTTGHGNISDRQTRSIH